MKRRILEFCYALALCLTNNVVMFVPCAVVRRLFCRLLWMKIGRGSELSMGIYLQMPSRVTIGRDTYINRGVWLDGRGIVKIGNSVTISPRVTISSAGHDAQSTTFEYVSAPISICDYAWVGINATILKGVTIGEDGGGGRRSRDEGCRTVCHCSRRTGTEDRRAAERA